MSRWEPNEDAFLSECCRAGISGTGVARLLERSHSTTVYRRRSLGFRFYPKPKPITPRNPHRVADIQIAVAAHFNLSVADLKSQARHRRIVRPRQIGMFLAREVAEKSYPLIGQLFGNRDHTTVIHAVRQIERLCGERPAFAAEVSELKNIVQSVDGSHPKPFCADSGQA